MLIFSTFIKVRKSKKFFDLLEWNNQIYLILPKNTKCLQINEHTGTNHIH